MWSNVCLVTRSHYSARPTRFASRGPCWLHWLRLGLGRRRLMTRQAKVTDRVGGLVTQLYNLDHHYRLTITVWQTTSKILCLLNQLESSDKGSEYYVSKLWRFHKIVTSQAKNTDCFSHCYLLTKADSYHTGHLRITYGNPRQLPEKGAKNVYLGI